LIVFVCLATGSVLTSKHDARENVGARGDVFIPNRTTRRDVLTPNITDVSGCPVFSEIPVSEQHKQQPELDYFYAGRFYSYPGHDIPALACNDKEPYDAADDYRHSSDQGFGTMMGSIMVNPGCTWYLFEDYNYEGRYVEYSGGNSGLLISKVPQPSWGTTCGDNYVTCFHSYLVSCEQRFPNCAPKDGWQPITSLDNSQSHVEAPFTFQQTIGTTWSNEVSESMSVSERVEESISENFFGVFEASLGFSIETSMDWGSVTKQEKSKTDQYTVGPIMVPAGDLIWVEGAIGTCGKSTVETHMYRVISSTGEVLTIE